MHTPGKLLYTADTLSCAPQPTEDHDLLDEAESFVEAIVSTLPATTQQLDAYQKAQADDSVCCKVMDYCHTQWPQKSPTDPLLELYWKVRESLSIHNDLLMYNLRIVVPHSLQKETLQSPQGTPRDCLVHNENQDVSMEIIELPEIEDYWKTSWSSEVPFFTSVMRRD